MSNKTNIKMKYTEFHKSIRKKGKKRGWRWTGKAEGSHYIYEDNKGIRYPVPYHGAKEMPGGLRIKISKEMELE